MLVRSIALVSLIFALVLCLCVGGFAGTAFLWILPVSFAGCFVFLGLAFFVFLVLVCAAIDFDEPQEEESKFHRGVTQIFAEAIVNVLCMKVRTRGMEQVPKDGRFLLVCNHLNDLDPVVLLHLFPKKQLAFISKRENKDMFVVGKLMHKIQCQLINRENDREALKTILKCISLIKEDKASVAVFPEGYTSLDGKLHHFRAGVFKIAMKANVPIVVCTVQNTARVFKNLTKLNRTEIPVHLLTVIQPEELKGKTAVEVSDRVYEMMLSDLGPDFIPETQA